MLSRVLGSASIIAASESSQPIAAFGGVEDRDGLGRGAGVESPSEQLGGWRRRARRRAAGSGVRCGSCLQNPPDSTPPATESGGGGEAVGADHRGQRIVAPANGRPAQPGGDAFGEVLGSNTATGPPLRRRREVAVRLSGLVLVVTTAPGASRIALMTTCRPLPERAGRSAGSSLRPMPRPSCHGWHRAGSRHPAVLATQGGPQRGRAVQQCLSRMLRS